MAKKLSVAFELGLSISSGDNSGSFKEDVDGETLYTALIIRRLF